ncbi:hypothetical protein OTU49_001944 [Cherax quadricarinatus]|uniref:Secreted protein n=1 Tax=Cherax quadricarinatus TaxID=27406 RepID=A0AAW0XDG9_CHEQU
MLYTLDNSFLLSIVVASVEALPISSLGTINLSLTVMTTTQSINRPTFHLTLEAKCFKFNSWRDTEIETKYLRDLPPSFTLSIFSPVCERCLFASCLFTFSI